MSSIFWILIIIASSLLLIAAIAFLRAKNLFIMNHIAMVNNCYIVTLFLLAVGLEKFSFLHFAKIIILIILNLIITNLVCHAITRRAMINRITPDAEIKKN